MSGIQWIEELGTEFDRVARAARPRRTLRRGAAVLAAIAIGAFAVPATRAAISDAVTWFTGDEAGREIRPDDRVPDYVREGHGRLIAETNGVTLTATRGETKHGPYLDFAIGNNVGFGNTLEGWREEFSKHAVIVLGPGTFGHKRFRDARDRYPLAGVTGRGVTRIELRYASGPPLVADGIDGGFVVLADAGRQLREVVAYDRNGTELERRDVSWTGPAG